MRSLANLVDINTFEDALPIHVNGKPGNVNGDVLIGVEIVYSKCLRRDATRDTFNCSDKVLLHCAALRSYTREVMLQFNLDRKNRLLGTNTIGIGTCDQLTIRIAEMFRVPIALNAASFILVHNHPSGDTTPSDDDVDVTKKIKKSAAMLDIKFLDHIIVGFGASFYSFAAKGRL